MSKEMEDKLHGAKKNSLHALHKLMKDLHHKTMSSSPKEASVMEVHAEALPDAGEHDEENVGKGIDPFDASDMEDESEAPDAHLPEAHLPGEPEDEDSEEEHSSPEMHLPDGLKEMLMHHLKNKK